MAVASEPLVVTVLEALQRTLRAAMLEDDRVVLLGEDIAARGNVFLLTKGFLEEFGARRVVDTPLSEAAIVGVAIGMALEGLRPIAEIQFADFIFPAYSQIVGEASKLRYRSDGDWHVPLVIRAPYGGGVRGALSHSISVEALFHHVPGLSIVAPAFPGDAAGLLNAALDDPDPVLFLEHKRTYRSVRGPLPPGRHVVPIGRANVVRDGTHATIVTYGYCVHQALAAAERLAAEGLAIEVVDLRSIRPMDRTTILASVRKTHRLLIVHEDQKFGGVGAEIAAMVAEEALFDLDAPIARLCGPDVPAMGYAATLEAAFLVSADAIADASRALARY